MISKKLLASVGAVAVLGTGLVTTTALAQTDPVGINDQNPMTSLVQKISQRFGLNQADVQAVFDQDKQDRQAQMQQLYAQRLDQLVSEGKITAAQKQLILDKQKELQSQHEADHATMQNLTEEQRRAQMEQRRQELETWAEQNGIDLSVIGPFGKGFGKGFGGKHGSGFRGMRPSASATPTATAQ